MKSGKVVLGLLAGIATGALLGILFAPEKGSKTRKKIADKSKGIANDMKDKLDDLYVDATDKYESLLQDAKGLVSKKIMKNSATTIEKDY